MTIAKLKHLCETLPICNSDFAKLLGISDRHLRNLLNGTRGKNGLSRNMKARLKVALDGMKEVINETLTEQEA